MPNKTYLKGVRKERKVVKHLKEDGWEIAQRSAGSHSPIDVFAINKKTKVIKLIQCKPDSISTVKRVELENEYHWLNNMFMVEFEVI
ncbi:hypothetical protein ACFL1X_14850 [Candidatus Hydrogenedentota bacterium]